MIKPVEQWLKSLPQIRKVHHPAGFLSNRTTDVNFNPERMPMHAGTFMPRRDVGKPVSGFNLKNSKYIHGRIVPSMH